MKRSFFAQAIRTGKRIILGKKGVLFAHLQKSNGEVACGDIVLDEEGWEDDGVSPVVIFLYYDPYVV